MIKFNVATFCLKIISRRVFGRSENIFPAHSKPISISLSSRILFSHVILNYSCQLPFTRRKNYFQLLFTSAFAFLAELVFFGQKFNKLVKIIWALTPLNFVVCCFFFRESGHKITFQLFAKIHHRTFHFFLVQKFKLKWTSGKICVSQSPNLTLAISTRQLTLDCVSSAALNVSGGFFFSRSVFSY